MMTKAKLKDFSEKMDKLSADQLAIIVDSLITTIKAMKKSPDKYSDYWDKINDKRNQLRVIAHDMNLESPEKEDILKMKENHDNKT